MTLFLWLSGCHYLPLPLLAVEDAWYVTSVEVGPRLRAFRLLLGTGDRSADVRRHTPITARHVTLHSPLRCLTIHDVTHHQTTLRPADRTSLLSWPITKQKSIFHCSIYNKITLRLKEIFIMKSHTNKIYVIGNNTKCRLNA